MLEYSGFKLAARVLPSRRVGNCLLVDIWRPITDRARMTVDLLDTLQMSPRSNGINDRKIEEELGGANLSVDFVA